MTNREIEQKLKNAAENCTPDVLDRIMSECDTKKGDVIIMTERKNSFTKKFAAIAAAIIVVAGVAGFGFNYYRTANSIVSTVSLDVNPSIELKLNKNAKVMQANALNDDAKEILNGLELEGTHANTAASAIIGSLLQNGYIDELANSILVSVEDTDSARAEKLQQELTEQITKALDGAAANAAVIAQHMNGENLDEVAEQYNISHGKAELIERIAEANPTYSKEELAALSVNELNLILSNPKNDVAELVTSGTASDSAYIGAEKAKEIALSHVGVKATDAFDFEVDFDYEYGKMIYEVDFDTKNREYEIHVDAATGDIITAHSEYGNNAAESTTAASQGEQTTSAKDIGKDKAKQIALEKAGVKEADVQSLRITSDYDDGRLEYKVEFIYNKKEYEYEINAESGTITDYDIDYHSALDTLEEKYEGDYVSATAEDNAVNVDGEITAEQAKQIALNKAGLNEADVTALRVEKDYDDGTVEYSVEFRYNGKEYEYEINGKTGTITDYDIELFDD